MNTDTIIRPMNADDYDAVFTLLRQLPGVALRSADTPDAFRRYLERNPGLSLVALRNGRLAGCLMAGHDGRRGYLQHLAVDPAQQRAGLGSALVAQCVASLQALDIVKCHVDVFKENAAGAAFWNRHGWMQRHDIDRYSFISNDDRNA
ncbi:GNAT family N-acetyltransferase [Chitinasiproducens palmae]|uniref:Ribosomal protein S18 acetylase RimI n=1 Tax=Chitinasiproducens palmae TaxID=1770053 RepID=A0A1H2PTM8_9BURK|nr:GNAT family N-acetyltransferase [Chitinasiproducens palmae]SDV50471.1 Ribosomal protein S18 acetylase RimI [Chitinasiproducens palmae]